jgi:hypothetical protein
VLRKIEKSLAAEGHRGDALTGEFVGLYFFNDTATTEIYTRTDEGYLVLRIGHRREVYRRGPPR